MRFGGYSDLPLAPAGYPRQERLTAAFDERVDDGEPAEFAAVLHVLAVFCSGSQAEPPESINKVGVRTIRRDPGEYAQLSPPAIRGRSSIPETADNRTGKPQRTGPPVNDQGV